MELEDVPSYLEAIRLRLLPIIGSMLPIEGESMERFHHMLGYYRRDLQNLIEDLERRENELRHADK